MSVGGEEMLIHENRLSVEEFCDLQESVGFGRPNSKQIEIGLKNSIYTVSVEINNKIVGMGRLVGDNARIFYLQDIFVNPDYQKKGIGTAIVNKLLMYIENIRIKDCDIMVGLMAAKGKENFYKKFGFKNRPNSYQGSGMMTIINK